MSATQPVRAVAIVATNAVGAHGAGMSDLRSALSEGRSGLRAARSLPESTVALPFEAYLGAVTTPLAALPAAVNAPELATRQLRLAWTALLPLRQRVAAACARFGAHRVGLLMGSSTGGVLASEQAYSQFTRSGALPESYCYRTSHALDAVPHALARELHLRGPVYAVSAACASAAKALASARRLIQVGACDAVLCGGVDSLCQLTTVGFHSLGVLRDAPCAPFGGAPHGMNVAEGAAWLLLEAGVGPVYLVGAGESSDAYSLTTPDPSGAGARRAIDQALDAACLKASAVDLINAHGTGTQANDSMEGPLLRTMFPGAFIHSTKAIEGHQLGAAGATEAVACAEVLRGTCPSSATGVLQLGTVNSPMRCALSNSFAFAGANASLLLSTEPHGRVSEPRSQSAAPGDSPCPAQPLAATLTRVAGWAPGYPTLDAVLRRLELDQEVSGEFSPADPDVQPAASLLPARARGRASLLTKMLAEVLHQLEPDPVTLRELPIVYASAWGQAKTTMELLELHFRGERSPLRFQSSVHNAPAGMLSIATGSRAFTTTLAAGDASVAAAFTEAITLLDHEPALPRVAVLCGDELPPPPLNTEHFTPLAVAFMLERSSRAPAMRIGLPSRAEFASGDALRLPPGVAQNPIACAVRLALRIKRQQAGCCALFDARTPLDQRWEVVLSAPGA